jgi:hypothetical protein
MRLARCCRTPTPRPPSLHPTPHPTPCHTHTHSCTPSRGMYITARARPRYLPRTQTCSCSACTATAGAKERERERERESVCVCMCVCWGVCACALCVACTHVRVCRRLVPHCVCRGAPRAATAGVAVLACPCVMRPGVCARMCASRAACLVRHSARTARAPPLNTASLAHPPSTLCIRTHTHTRTHLTRTRTYQPTHAINRTLAAPTFPARAPRRTWGSGAAAAARSTSPGRRPSSSTSAAGACR